MTRTGLLVVALLVISVAVVTHHVGPHDAITGDHVADGSADHGEDAGDALIQGTATTCLGLLVGLWVYAGMTGRVRVRAAGGPRTRTICADGGRRRQAATPVALRVVLRI